MLALVHLRRAVVTPSEYTWRRLAAERALGGASVAVEASCCEVYNETVTDLLGGGDAHKQLQARGRAGLRVLPLGGGCGPT